VSHFLWCGATTTRRFLVPPREQRRRGTTRRAYALSDWCLNRALPGMLSSSSLCSYDTYAQPPDALAPSQSPVHNFRDNPRSFRSSPHRLCALPHALSKVARPAENNGREREDNPRTRQSSGGHPYGSLLMFDPAAETADTPKHCHTCHNPKAQSARLARTPPMLLPLGAPFAVVSAVTATLLAARDARRDVRRRPLSTADRT